MTVSLKNILRAGCMLGIAMAFLAAPVVAQPPGGGGRGGFGGGGFGGGMGGFGGGIMGLLSNDDVKKELQLLDDQTAKLDTLRTEMGTEMRDLFQPGADPEETRTKMAEFGKKTEAEVAKVLDSDQMKRLKQIEFQQSINRGMTGFASGILSNPIVEQLGLTKEQVDQLTEAQKAADEDYRKKQAALRTEALEKLISTLPPEQQAKFKELYGKQFEMRAGFGGGAAGGRGPGGGGQGGNRGGGNRQRPGAGGSAGGDRNL